MIKVFVQNHAETPLGFKLEDYVAALKKYSLLVDERWHTAESDLEILDSGVQIPKKQWGLAFFDNADQPDALGYHDDHGAPLSKIFVKTTLDAGELLSVTGSHEIGEMKVDPRCNRMVSMRALEIADPVQEESFLIDGFDMSNFVYPDWFEAGSASPWDYNGAATGPLVLTPGGYVSVFTPGQGWGQQFGSERAQLQFGKRFHSRVAARI